MNKILSSLLYITFHDLDPSAGVSKKILDQVEAFKENGIDTKLLAVKNVDGVRSAYIDNTCLGKIGHGIVGYMDKSLLYRKIVNYIKQNHINLLFIRYTQDADPFYIWFLKQCKLMECSILLEIPTYPYDGEFSNHNIVLKAWAYVERKYRRQLSKYVDKIVTTSEFDIILNIPTIKISNGINSKIIPLVNKQRKRADKEIVFISVATISFWHGLDRMINGIYRYIRQQGSRRIRFLIVGGGEEMALDGIKQLIKDLNLSDTVSMLGPKYGAELDGLYNEADIAVGCLACHRKNIVEVKSLKNVDYAMRGLPMFYSEYNTDFDSRPYVFKVPSDDSPIDIDAVISFYESLTIPPMQIRESVKHLTWEQQIKKVLLQL